MKPFLLLLIIFLDSLTMSSQTFVNFISKDDCLDLINFIHYSKLNKEGKLKYKSVSNPYILTFWEKINRSADSTFMISSDTFSYHFSCAREAFRWPDREIKYNFSDASIVSGRLNYLIPNFLEVPESRFFKVNHIFYYDLDARVNKYTTIDQRLNLSNIFLKALNLKVVLETIDTNYLNLIILNAVKLKNVTFEKEEFEQQKKLVDQNKDAFINLYANRNKYRTAFYIWQLMEKITKNIVEIPLSFKDEYTLNIDPDYFTNCNLAEINQELYKSGLQLTVKTGKVNFYRFVNLYDN